MACGDSLPASCQSHCLEHALMDDMSESSDTLHAFNVYKPSYAEIRWSINWSTKMQHIYKIYSYIWERSTMKPA